MNYEALQLLIKSLINNFKCDMCASKITGANINILSIDGKKISLDIHCNNCKKNSIVKSEVMTMDLGKMKLTQNQIMMIKNSVNSRNINKTINNRETLIKDEIIVELDKNLKKDKLNVEDLLGM